MVFSRTLDEVWNSPLAMGIRPPRCDGRCVNS